MPRLLLALLLLGASGVTFAEDLDIGRLFDKAHVEGTLVIESADTGQRYVHDEARANPPFTAASTFMALHTLIALEEGAIAGADEIIPWDGTHYEIEDWNRDQTLKSAFRVSCVWCYQRLARRVGAAAYPRHIRQAHYGLTACTPRPAGRLVASPASAGTSAMLKSAIRPGCSR